MSAQEFRKKPWSEMAKRNTKPVKVGRYMVTSHCQNRMVLRDISKEELIQNVCRKPVVKTKVSKDSQGRPGYMKYNNSTVSVINPKEKRVASIRGYHDSEAKKMGIKNHKPYARQSESTTKPSTKKISTSSKKVSKTSVKKSSGTVKRRKTTTGRTKSSKR